MSYKYKLTDNYCILNFSEEYVKTPQDLLASDTFKHLFCKYFENIKKNNPDMRAYLLEASGHDEEKLKSDCFLLLRLLLVMNAEEIMKDFPELNSYLVDLRMTLRMIEEIYLFWRRHERYSIIANKEQDSGLEDVSFLEAQRMFQDLVLTTYRQIESSLGHENKVYRQIIAGVNAAMSLNEQGSNLPEPYSQLNDIPIVERVSIHPPFITYSKKHTRDGVFDEVYTNPICDKKFDNNEWYCYPIRVGGLITFVYFHEKFMHSGISLCNLFSMAEKHEYVDKNPDLILVFGYDDNQQNECFYQDKENNIMFGFISLNDKFDYFGYLKKMILTLHNVFMLNNNKLPIHGAMIEISFKDGSKKSIIIVGDSGAGKSETIEQIKKFNQDNIIEIKTVYDDMGILFTNEKGKVVSSGTEIGAFIRLDDLDTGVGYKEIDRSVFMNPDKINARIVTPVAFWRDIVVSYDVDLFLYANNYDSKGEVLEFFDNLEDAIDVFKAGKRMSKGTTTEKGITKSFFANPFGPVQRQEQTIPLLKQYFELMFKQDVKIGQIKTRLGVPSFEMQGPKEAAKALSEFILS